MIFLLYVGVFVACSCVVLPLAMFAVCLVRTGERKARPAAKRDAVSFPATDGVR
jgi:hypothetical protein